MGPSRVRILGSGIVSRVLALALARQGLPVAVDARTPGPEGGSRPPDVRAYALNATSVELLRQLKAWDALPADARTPVHDMQVCGDAAGALDFSAWQQAVPVLAWIVDAAELEEVLETALRFAAGVQAVAAGEDETRGPDPELVVVAEGKAAATRERLGVVFERHPYGHSALASRVVSDRPHAGVARQWFRAPDVLALLPFDRPQPGCSYGLVWSLPTAEAERLREAPPAEFEHALHEASGAQAGTLRLGGPRTTWPLMQARARSLCGPGWVLVGDAAHVMHPLAGQGLNLGLADVAALARTLAGREPWRSLGDEALLRRYARGRRWEVQSMTGLVDGLWHLFAADNEAAKELRNRGMTLVNHLGPLKRWLVGRALGT